MNPEKLAKLQAHAAQVRIGGKGSARRKKKFVHRSAADDKKIHKEATKAEPDVKPGPSHPKKEEPKITELKLSEAFIEKCNVSTSTVPIDVKVETSENGKKNGGTSMEESKIRYKLEKYMKSYSIIVKKGVKLGEGEGWESLPQGMSGFWTWNSKVFYTFQTLKDLEAILNSRTDYEKGHKLRALCTVFFTRVNKDLLFKIKSETDNEIIRRKAEEDSGVVIDDVRHIGLGRTIRVHCRTPSGADTLVKNGLLIGGMTLRKGKIEELKPVVQCTHCWQMDHKIGKCLEFATEEPAICGTCSKTGHRRKECPTPNDPKCVLCGGKHSSSAARCPVRIAKIKEINKSHKEGQNAEDSASQRLKKIKEIADKLKGLSSALQNLGNK